MKTFCFQMGSTICEIAVDAKPTTNGPAVFSACAFVSENDGDILRPIWRKAQPRPFEILSSDELDAATRMAGFLEKAFGAGVWPLSLCASSDKIQIEGEKWEIE